MKPRANIEFNIKFIKLASNFTVAQESKLREITAAEPPPYANNMKELFENCQGWTLRVLAKCVQENLLSETSLNECKTHQEPIWK